MPHVSRSVCVLFALFPLVANAGELHSSTLVKDSNDSFVCSATNLRTRTIDIEFAIISGGTPPEEIFRTTLSCDAGETCSIGTSASDDRTVARCSVFFAGSARKVRAVLRTFDANDRSELR